MSIVVNKTRLPVTQWQTESGSVVSISDARKRYAKSLSVALEPIQDLHGYANPWPAGCGSNVLDDSTVEGGYSLSAQGLPTPTAKRLATTTAIPVNGSQITVSYSTTINTVVFLYSLFNGDTLIERTANKANGSTINISGATKMYISWYDSQSSDITSGVVSKIMVNYGSTALPYAPYSNPCPISGRSSVTAVRDGKNLCDTGAYTIPGNSSQNTIWEGELNGPLTVSFDTSEVTSVVSENERFFRLDVDGTAVYYNYNQTTGVTVNGKLTKINVYGKNAYSRAEGVVKPQIERGFTATAYEPYQGISVTLSLGQTVYGGLVDVVSGVMTVEYVKQSITAFTNIWSGSYSNGTPVYAVIAGSTHDIAQVDPAMMKSNMFTYSKLGRASAPLYSYGCNSGADTTQTFVLPSSITTLAEANAWLSSLSEPLECTFKLATPITIQLSPNQIEMLMRNNTVWSDAGVVTLNYARIRQ